MNNKIPCGGFYLSDTLGVDENGKLGVNGGEPYKSLVTDGTGGVKWEDRLAYEGSRLVVDLGRKGPFVKVADKAPSWMSVDAPTNVWISKGQREHIITVSQDDNVGYDNGSFRIFYMVFVITEDNTIIRIDENDEGRYEFPKKGVYFGTDVSEYISGIASADSDTPEITWDGSLETIKKIDEKFLPECPVFTVQTKGTDKYLHDANGERMTLEQAKSIGLNFVIQSEHGNGSLIKPISVVYDSQNARFYALKLEDTFGDGITVKFNTYYAGEDIQSAV